MTASFTLKAGSFDDIPSFVEIVRQSDMEVMGQTNVTAEYVESDWRMPRFDPATDVRLAFDDTTGRVVGFQAVFATRAIPARAFVWGWVHPEFRRRGIGEALTRWAMERGEQLKPLVPDNAKMVLEFEAPNRLVGAKELYHSFGLHTERSFYTMLIEMNARPEVLPLPDGFHLITYAQRPDLDFFLTARTAGFSDHRGFIAEPMELLRERWQNHIDSQEHFDPELWIMAMHGDEPAALVWGDMDSDVFSDAGWISSVATLPAYRKRGLAHTLLKHSFAQFYERGLHKVALGVDASSLTGAVGLYERAGMSIFRQFDVYEHLIRDGVELTHQG